MTGDRQVDESVRDSIRHALSSIPDTAPIMAKLSDVEQCTLIHTACIVAGTIRDDIMGGIANTDSEQVTEQRLVLAKIRRLKNDLTAARWDLSKTS